MPWRGWTRSVSEQVIYVTYALLIAMICTIILAFSVLLATASGRPRPANAAPSGQFPFAAPVWRKSSASAQGNCVEVAIMNETVLVRDTKAAGAGPTLNFDRAAWNNFITTVQSDQFHR
jgi:hypothetical protein